MTRVDLYGSVHKGLRALLYRTGMLVARTDFGRADECAATAAALGELLGFLDEHAEHEDDAILPELARLAPGLHAELAAEHVRVHGMQADLAGLVARLEGASSAERAALGRRLHERMAHLTAAHLVHMDREEVQANRVLWAHLDDDALRALEGRIVGSIPGPRMQQWMELMLPAAHLSERAEMLAGMRAAMPAEVFDELTAPARRALGEELWILSLEAAGVEPVAAR